MTLNCSMVLLLWNPDTFCMSPLLCHLPLLQMTLTIVHSLLQESGASFVDNIWHSTGTWA